MSLIRLYIGRLCFKLSLGLAMAGVAISGIDRAPTPSLPLYHY